MNCHPLVPAILVALWIAVDAWNRYTARRHPLKFRDYYTRTHLTLPLSHPRP